MPDHYGLEIDDPPEAEPIGLAEAKVFLKHDYTQEGDLIESLIKTAREYAESFADLTCCTATWKLTLDQWPGYNCRDPYGWSYQLNDDPRIIRIPRPPLQSVESVKYLDMTSTQQTLATTEYRVVTATRPGRIAPAFGKFWPPALPTLGAIEISYTAGFGDEATDVPERIRQAIRMLVAHWFVNREQIGTALPAADCLLMQAWSGR